MKRFSFVSFVSLPASLLLLYGTGLPQSAFGCATCGCSLSSDWETQGYSIVSGLKMDILYNFIDQTQLRHGTGSITQNQVPLGQELETFTRNNYITLGFDYDFNSDWGTSIQLPYVIRDHATLGNDHESPDSSGTSSLGDMRLLARYQGFLPGHNLGVELGIKLPTGAFDVPFRSSPQNLLDRGLQPGTGTTDLIAGIYYFDRFSPDWGYFATATVQTALDYRDQYKPGTAENLTFGVRYTGIERFVPQLQINGRLSNRDNGGQADIADTGGALIYLAPGVTFEVSRTVSVFTFVQVPVYQNVNGYQLAPRWTLSAGMRWVF